MEKHRKTMEDKFIPNQKSLGSSKSVAYPFILKRLNYADTLKRKLIRNGCGVTIEKRIAEQSKRNLLSFLNSNFRTELDQIFNQIVADEDKYRFKQQVRVSQSIHMLRSIKAARKRFLTIGDATQYYKSLVDIKLVKNPYTPKKVKRELDDTLKTAQPRLSTSYLESEERVLVKKRLIVLRLKKLMALRPKETKR